MAIKVSEGGTYTPHPEGQFRAVCVDVVEMHNVPTEFGPKNKVRLVFQTEEQLADGRDDLDGFGVDFQNWFSENSLFDTGLVARCLDKLDAAGHIYEQNGARWFRSTAVASRPPTSTISIVV